MCFASQSLEQTRRVSALGKGGCSPGYSECCSTTLSYCSTLVTAEILSIIRRLKTGSGSISHPPATEKDDVLLRPQPPRGQNGRALGETDGPGWPRRPPLGPPPRQHPETLLPALRRRPAGSSFSQYLLRFTNLLENSEEKTCRPVPARAFTELRYGAHAPPLPPRTPGACGAPAAPAAAETRTLPLTAGSRGPPGTGTARPQNRGWEGESPPRDGRATRRSPPGGAGSPWGRG